LVGYRADLCNLRTSHTTGKIPQSPGETKTETLLEYQHQDWMLKE
jgi:hypothetical protein